MASLATASVVVALAGAWQPAAGLVVEGPRHLRGDSGTVATVAMHTYRQECGRRVAAGGKIPGAGMDPSAIQPFTKVLKDGFYEVDCVKDYMFEHGDKFGDNRFSYKLGEVSNVSIVHYSAHVSKEDKEGMTHEACFRFCRTVPDMNFFGMTNGGGCYCTPYYEAEADDSSMCDVTCEGNHGTFCGGKTKSSIFGMHACSNTASDLAAKASSMSEAAAALDEVLGLAEPTAADMQSQAEAHQDAFGQAGDPGAANLMQSAMIFAGEVSEAARRASKLAMKLGELQQAKEGLKGADFSSPAELAKAEELMKDMEAAASQAEGEVAGLRRLLKLFLAAEEGPGEGTAKQYYSTMYFVDKEFKDVPSTCTGTESEAPFMGTRDACAQACDSDVGECVAFSFFGNAGQQAENEGPGLCFLMKQLKTITYFTDCGEQGGAAETKCFAKLSKFEGTTLKPNPSGKCENCLKEAKHADRCFQ